MTRATYVYRIGPEVSEGYSVAPIKIKNNAISGKLTLMDDTIVNISDMDKPDGTVFTTMGRAYHYYLKSKKV